MTVQDQHEVIEFLSVPASYGLRSGQVERIDTHISAVFLAGPRAYKLKRAVTFPYADFSSLERRRTACEREIQLNRRTAPSVYRAVVAVTREPGGHLALGGLGEPVEWLVEMVRFDNRLLLDRLAAEGRLDVPIVTTLARRVAFFHDGARPRRDHGGRAAMRQVVDGNLDEMLADTSGALDPDLCRRVHARSVAAIEGLATVLDARRVHGLVRQCHGDLHLHNAFLLDGEPTLFDAIEFNDDLACIDVVYDFAFLLMDLAHRGLARHANAALNAYLDARPDYRGLSLLPLFLSCRAAIRAKVDVAQAAVQATPAGARPLRDAARQYLRMAVDLAEPAPPALVAIGGFSGSGKSTLASRLAPSVGAVPGAVVIRTDVIRKQLFGIDPLHRLPPRAYRASVSARVYARALHAAEACLRSGHSAIVDAVFADPHQRREAERLAADAGVPFTGVWLEVPFEVAAARLQARTADVSDATPQVLRAQMRRDIGRMQWTRLDGRDVGLDAPITLRDVAALAGKGLGS